LIFLLQCFVEASAQENDFFVKGIVTDASTGLPLNDVNISLLESGNQGTSSDSLGRFRLKIIELPASLKFTFVGYEDKTIEIASLKQKLLKIRLTPKTIPLPEISVSAKRKIDTVFHQPLNVVDYVFKGDVIILLIYKNVFEKYQLATLDQDEQIIATLSLTDYRPGNLFTSCTGSVYLNTDIGAYAISVDSSAITLSKRLDEYHYENIIRPCVTSTDSFVYFSRYFYQGQAQQYFGFSKKDEAQKITFPIIQHVHNIDLLIEETGTGFPRSGDVWQKKVSFRLASLRNASYGVKGMMKVFYPKLYAPMFKKDSLLCIFNHQDSEMQFYEANGTKIKDIPIQYHRFKKWNKQLIYDTKNEKAYTIFDTKWGNQICPIDMKTGAIGDAIPIEREFIEKLKIHGGNLYFLYRNPYRGSRKTMLQKIRID